MKLKELHALMQVLNPAAAAAAAAAVAAAAAAVALEVLPCSSSISTAQRMGLINTV
jgi:hypothetical protein